MYKGVVCSSMEQKEGKHTFIILANGPTWKTPFSIMFNLMYSGKNFGLVPPLHIWAEDNNPTLGTAENPKGRAGDIMVKSYFNKRN